MERGKLVFKRKKRGAREKESWPDFYPHTTRPATLNWMDLTDSGHLTGRAWYRFEAWKPAGITQPSSSPETDQNASNWAQKLVAKTHFRWSLGKPPAGFYSSRHQHHFPTNLVTWNGRIANNQPLGKLADLEARSAAVAARGRSPPAPLDSLRSELSDLSFLSSLTDVRSPLTSRGNSVNS